MATVAGPTVAGPTFADVDGRRRDAPHAGHPSRHHPFGGAWHPSDTPVLSFGMANRKRLALTICSLLAECPMGALAQGDPNAAMWRKGWDMQVADMMNSAAVVGKAIGCGVVSPAGNARQSIIAWANELWQQGIRHGAVRPTPESNGTTLDMSILGNMDRKMRDSEASVKRPNGCEFWKDQPATVYRLQQLDGQ